MLEDSLRQVKRVNGFLSRQAKRTVKSINQKLTYAGPGAKPVFIVGCQRSGTNMVMRVLDRSLNVKSYNEDNRQAFDNYRLKQDDVIHQLVEKANSDWVAFKPLCDSQNIDRLLERYPDAKALWIYRDYRDSTNSAAKHWSRGQIALIKLLATNEDWEHWLVERLSDDRRQLVTSLYDHKISIHEAASLKWFIRNEIYFDYDLAKLPERVKLVRYESLVNDPVVEFGSLFKFLDIEFDPDFVADVFNSSIRKSEFPRIDTRISELCSELLQRLEHEFEVKVHV